MAKTCVRKPIAGGIAAAGLFLAAFSCGDAPVAGPAAAPAREPCPAPAAEPEAANLEFGFPPDFSFTLALKAENSRTRGSEGGVQTFDLRMRGRVGEVKAGRPSTLNLFDVSGSQEFLRLGDGESEPEKTDNRGGGISGDIDESWRLKNARDTGHLSDDILLVYPAGPVFGFVPPGGKIAPGGRWPSGSLVPAGPKTISKRQLVFSEAEGEFELASLEAGKARISWTGKAKAESGGRAARSASWQSTILFDCKARRTDSVETEFKIEFDDGTFVEYGSSAAFAYP